MFSQHPIIIFKEDKDDLLSPAIIGSIKALPFLKISIGHQAIFTSRQFLEYQGYQLVRSSALDVQPMGVAGNGLFAKEFIAKGEIVAIHGGVIRLNKPASENDYKQIISNTLLHIDGKKHLSAADMIQHGVSPLLIHDGMAHALTGSEYLTTANVMHTEIDTGFGFSLQVLIAEEDIYPGQIIAREYGLNYLLNQILKEKLSKFIVWDKQKNETSFLLFTFTRQERNTVLSLYNQYIKNPNDLRSLVEIAAIFSVLHYSFLYMFPLSIRQELRILIQKNIANSEFQALFLEERKLRIEAAKGYLRFYSQVYTHLSFLRASSGYRAGLEGNLADYKSAHGDFSLENILNVDDDFVFNHPTTTVNYLLSEASLKYSNTARYYIAPCSGEVLDVNELTKSYQKAIKTGRAEFKSKHYDKAIEFYQQALHQAKDVHLLLGLAQTFEAKTLIFCSATIQAIQFDLYRTYIEIQMYEEAFYFINLIQHSVKRYGEKCRPKTLSDEKVIECLNVCCQHLGFPLLPLPLPASIIKKYKLNNSSAQELGKGLRTAAVNNYVEDLKIFMAQVNINQYDSNPKQGKTALHWAIIKGSLESIKILLEAGARMDIADANKKTAWNYAVESEDRRIIELLSLHEKKECGFTI